jgi:integrase
MRLTAKRILKARKRIGRYADGAGLYLQVASPSAASWILRFERDGRERWLGLGPLHTVGLSEARTRAKAARLQLLDGVDPVDARKAAKAAKALEAAKAVTFQECAESHFDQHETKWRNSQHRQQYIASLRNYVFPAIGRLPVSSIDTGLVLKCLEPIWTTIPETASRIRQRIEAVLDYATTRNLRIGDNPARWSGHLEHILPALRSTTTIAHHPALPYAELPDFMRQLRAHKGVLARALEFTILTAARTGETIGARWDELAGGVWTIPGARMKSGQPHRVPLSKAAIALIDNLPREKDNPFVFIGANAGRSFSINMLRTALARIRDDVTVHGFRSTFRDWAAERTAYPFEVLEKALAHAIGSKVSRSYARSDLLAERAKLMEQWDAFCSSAPVERADKGATVVPMRARS